MLDQIFTRPCTLQRHLSGPLLDSRLRYLAHCAARGLSTGCLRRIAQHCWRAATRLNLSEMAMVRREQITAMADEWISRQPKHRNLKHARHARRLLIADTVNWLRFADLLHVPRAVSHPYEALLAEFAEYMRHERGLAAVTISHRCWRVNEFLGHACGSDRPLAYLTSADVDAALVRKGTEDGYARCTLQAYASTLRVFLRYADSRGLCPRGLAATVMSPRTYRDETLPSGPTWPEVQRLLAGTEGDDPTDIRDRAILLLLAVYGLRSGEVRQLQLDDLDWEREVIRLIRHKQRRSQPLPLAHTVGDALLRYLTAVRPRVTWREVFLSFHPPYRPLSSAAIYQVVGRRLKPLGLTLRHYGPHALRHACATHLLAQGLSLKEIGDYLGHRHPDTTRIYAKVDLNGLRRVGELDLGGLL